jgi:osmotically inducible protein OsmC
MTDPNGQKGIDMSEINRKAGAIWNGDLKDGHGFISTESRTIYELPYTHKTRFENEPGSNPEELLAAAHAACFTMALASTLKKKGITPVQLETTATCTLTSGDAGRAIDRMHLHVRGEVPDIDEAGFEKLVQETNQTCPVSKLLGKGLKITLSTALIEKVS